ncbi:GspH/FimT family pseudopilin [Microbulbifer yueqingensis]|uniref:Type II secretion system protein H n=1 Tax=Microbulbifer yueqingensis TaxID=658219 RepID=A0A1G9EVP0_9GAMM|nr:GspH/FimT family pseudopilin [Microbulbifer yueqingensis]SDK80209.1 type IV fimbrial biogenesis protein FimT [Microbulbifer yueqingensis]
MLQRGITLLELLVTLAILSILLALGAPGFSRQVQQTRVSATTEELQSAIQLARATALSRNQRVTLRSRGSWEAGWEAFADINSNGLRDGAELLIFSGPALESVSISWNDPAGSYVSFIGTGVSRRVNGALQMGTFRICPTEGTGGRALTLAPSGRLRSSRLDDC